MVWLEINEITTMSYVYITLTQIFVGVAVFYVVFQIIASLIALPFKKIINYILTGL